MISGLVQSPGYAGEFLHLACGPLSYGQDQDQAPGFVTCGRWKNARGGVRSADRWEGGIDDP
jgi:hypothetical protein